METYAGAVRRLCSVYADVPADREDLFQEIFLGVWRSLPAFRGESSERTWVYRIAHNVALTWQARHRRRQSRQMPLDDDSPPKVNPVDLRRMDLKRAVAHLSPANRSFDSLMARRSYCGRN